MKLCFDVAQGLPFAYHMQHFLITHSHMDHAGGIPYIISQKGLSNQQNGKFYMGEEMVRPMQKIMDGWHEMEGFEYVYDFISVEEGIEYDFHPGHFFKIFPTAHRVPSRGYQVYQRRKKLKGEYAELSQSEIIRLREEGKEVNTLVDTPILAFTGDTKIEFLDLAPEVKKSKILILECTYLDDRKTVESARKWGHIHLDELMPRLKELECEKILLTHLSSRYRRSDALKAFEQRIAREFPEGADRIELYP
jgi:ribonuclease Z